MRSSSLILKLLILILCSLWGAEVFAACRENGAQISQWSGRDLADCSGGKSCDFEMNKPINSGIWVCTHNDRPFEYQTVSIFHVGNNKSIMTVSGTLHGESTFSVFDAKVNNDYITESSDKIKEMFGGGIFSLIFKYPGNYVMRFCYSSIGSFLPAGLGKYEGCNYSYYFNIEPAISGLQFKVTDQAGREVSAANGSYSVPYSVKQVTITPEAKDKNATINEIKECSYTIPSENRENLSTDNDYIKNNTNGSFEIKNESARNAALKSVLLKPESTIALNVNCTLGASAYPEYVKNKLVEINIHRNKAQHGYPHFTLGGQSTTATDQYANWGAAQQYKIGVITERHDTLTSFDTCTINGVTHDYNNMLSVPVNSSELQNSCTADVQGVYKNCGSTRHYSGTCEIGSSPTSPYHAYPVKDIPIQNDFSITVFGPRITGNSDFSGQFSTISPNGTKGNEVRPGATVKVDTYVQLIGTPRSETDIQKKIQGEFPHVVVETREDKNLKSSQCRPDWTGSSGSGCQTPLTSAGSGKQGIWELKANEGLMERTDAYLRMYGSNHDGNINSQSNLLAEKKITITPLIRLAGKLETAPRPDALKDKVYHHGRQFTVPARYLLTAYNQLPDKSEQLNDRYSGKLTALQVTLDNALSVGNLAQALTVNGQSVGTNPHWNGRSQPAFMADNSPTALAHGQHSELQIPLTVTRSSHEPSRFKVTVAALGSYAGDNVDAVGDPALQPAGQLTFDLGPDLYPATEAFHMDVNNGVPLRVTPGQTEPLILQVDFNSPLAADKLATPEGIEGTVMNITLPPGLKRSEKEPIQFICNDGKDCNQSVKNSWDGKEQRNILPDLQLKPAGKYRLRIPLIAEHDGVAPSSSIKLEMSQSSDIEQDTIKRIVAWESEATASKPVEQAAHQDVTILPLNYKEQTIEAGNKMNIIVDVKNGQREDTVTLQSDGPPIPMQYKDNQGDIARFTSKQPFPMPEKADYSLQAVVKSKMKAAEVLTGPTLGDPRQLSCRWKNSSNLSCAFSWRAPLPFVSSDKLLSYQALNDTDKQLTETGRPGIMIMDPPAARNALLKQLQYMNGDGDWTNVIPFNLSSGEPQSNDSLPQPTAPDYERESLFESGKSLPARGTIKLRF